MADPDLTLVILREIQTRLGSIEQGVGSLDQRLGTLETGQNETITRLEAVEDRLGALETRFDLVDATATGLGAQVIFLGRYLKNNHEKAIAELRMRVSKLELKVGT